MYTKVGEERTWSRKYSAKNELEVNEKEEKLVQGRNHVNIVNKNVLSCDFLCFHFLMRESCPIFLPFLPFFLSFLFYFLYKIIFCVKKFRILVKFIAWWEKYFLCVHS